MAMCRRNRLLKPICVVIFYVILYNLISNTMNPTVVMFVSNELQFAEGKYAVMFLLAPDSEVFTDWEGADVFASRRCGSCFLTNNKGFLPMAEYDAVLVMGQQHLLSEAGAIMEPEKRYLIETNDRCVRHKLKCRREPLVTSFTTKKIYTLCSLCDELILEKGIKKLKHKQEI